MQHRLDLMVGHPAALALQQLAGLLADDIQIQLFGELGSLQVRIEPEELGQPGLGLVRLGERLVQPG